MDQLSLFDRSSSYRFPEKLLEYDPGFLSREEADTLQREILATTNWRQTSIRM